MGGSFGLHKTYLEIMEQNSLSRHRVPSTSDVAKTYLISHFWNCRFPLRFATPHNTCTTEFYPIQQEVLRSISFLR